MKPIIKVENLSKQYRLGTIGTGTVREDVQRWLHQIRGKEDPYKKIGEANDRSQKGESEYVWALREINFEVMPGEVLGIIGKNGAGKSTLLKILSKVTGPTTGRIDFNGRIGSLLEVGTGFHPELTGRENIFLNGAILGMTKREIKAKLDEIIDFSGCERYIDTPVKRYSSGMTVRLGFAVAAHLDPEILIVDEVLAVGDAEFQKKAIGKMQYVSRNEGRTVLFVSHNMASIQRLCSTGLTLGNGEIINSGRISECVKSYLSFEKDESSKIYDYITYKDDDIIISDIKVNKDTVSNILLGNDCLIKIEIEGHLAQNKHIAIEVRIYDTNEIPLAFFSPGHANGKVPMLKKGYFKLNYEIQMPKNMNKGTYIADIYLTYPGIKSWVEMKKCLIISVDGKTTETGMIFEYEKGAGFLLL